MSVTLYSRLIAADGARVAPHRVAALIRTLVEGRVVLGAPALFSGRPPELGPWLLEAPPGPSGIERMAVGADLDACVRELARVGEDADVCVAFPGIDAAHPEYAFHYRDPRSCGVAVVLLRQPIEIVGKITIDDDEDEPPHTEEITVQGATWIAFEGLHAPYEGELRGSYLEDIARDAFATDVVIVTEAY